MSQITLIMFPLETFHKTAKWFPLFTDEKRRRWDWDKIQNSINTGHTVTIRPATEEELKSARADIDEAMKVASLHE